MEQKRTRHTRRPKTLKPVKGFERLLNSRTFIALGAIFLLIGIYSSFSSENGTNGFFEMLKRFLIPEIVDAPTAEISGSGNVELLLYFIPAILILSATLIFARNYKTISYPVSLLTAIYLIGIQIKISYFNLNFGGCYYPDFFAATLLLLFPALLLLANSLIHRKHALLVFTCFYLYIAPVLLAINYFNHYEFLFTYVLFFSILVSWVAKRIKKPVIYIINIAFTWGFFGLFWLRKLWVHQNVEFLPLFFTFGILVYILFYAVILFAPDKKGNQFPKWMQFTITGSNLLIFLGTILWVLHRFYAPFSLPVFIGALLLFNILGIYLLKKLKLSAWELPYHYAVMILAALVLPFCFLETRLILFTAVLSVLMLGYAHKTKDPASFWISVISQGATVGLFLYSWIRFCLPAHFFVSIVPEPDLIGYGLLIGGLAIGSLGFTTWQLQSNELSHSHKWFSKRKYDRLVRIMLLFSILITLGWLGFSLVSQLTGSLNYTPLPWFIAGTLFFIQVIRYYSGKQSSLKRPILYLSGVFMLSYPFMVHLNMVICRTSMLIKNELNGIVLVLHYLALALVVILGRMVIKRIRRHHIKRNNVLRLTDLLTVSFLVFLLCTEYDNLTALFLVIKSSPGAQLMSGDPLLQNRFLPYSLIIWAVAVVVFIRAMIQRNHFMRNFGIVIFLGMLVKLFVIDFQTLETIARSIVYLLLGLFLIGFAYIFPRLQKGLPILPEFKRKEMRE